MQRSTKKVIVEKWLCPAFEKLANTEHLSDCRFIIEDADGGKKIFGCHKLLFCCASEVFERMFYGNFLESKTNEIVLKNVRPDIFAKFREFIYNYDVMLFEKCDENTLFDLIQFAQQYLVSSVTEECMEVLCQRASRVYFGKLIQLYQYGNDNLSDDVLKKIIMKNITSRFRGLMNHSTIYNLSSDAFFKYMKMSKNTLRDAKRFNMIENYLHMYDFDEENMDLEQHVQVDDNELEDISRSNVPYAHNRRAIENVKHSFVKNLLELIDYKQMTREEFLNGPADSVYFNEYYNRNDM